MGSFRCDRIRQVQRKATKPPPPTHEAVRNDLARAEHTPYKVRLLRTANAMTCRLRLIFVALKGLTQYFGSVIGQR